MRLLSSPLGRLRRHYDVVVVGSGYGGAITAARLAGTWTRDEAAATDCPAPRRAVRVAVLERGQEILPGEFPQRFSQLLGHTQLQIRGNRLGGRGRLFDLRIDRDLSVLTGSGLGGTSLINANVVLEPGPQVRSANDWPDELHFSDKEWNARFDRVRSWLNARPYPEPTRRELVPV
ncbi:MAG: hypothetical protein R3253_09565, partial [Longimicrobiales bacterium]|nr:hypothetical protein [Longimicrobiales bacterium]